MGSVVSTETPFQILKKSISLQFIFNVHGLKCINYLNIQIILLPDILRLLKLTIYSNIGWGSKGKCSSLPLKITKKKIETL